MRRESLCDVTAVRDAPLLRRPRGVYLYTYTHTLSVSSPVTRLLNHDSTLTSVAFSQRFARKLF